MKLSQPNPDRGRIAFLTLLLSALGGCSEMMKEKASVKRAALYTRVSTLDQNPQTQLIELRAKQRGYEIVQEYCDHGYSGARAKRPGLSTILSDARHARSEVLVWPAIDSLVRRSTSSKCLTNSIV